ncbi:unnamed protein product [[Candida] boidinii]|uniref:Unnamed protein product n=1 Tax=Candida boidinii TaxID=5477 RepID=A0A9W6T0W6_CANBO|nr:hypothetical protein BVG19_g3074 [[Candida] boidinii]OWB53039.1 hypothetical protein B5S27_g4625 [[Candida] boidinii]OWB67907.1 hypothetical protein B5S30_g3276 [[Candida] boidinii]GME68854.1 unnamed protein product [[Candida] boidinii]
MLNVLWFYASDIPLSKPAVFKYKQVERPKHFIPFSQDDSARLEAEFQKNHNNKSIEDSNSDNKNKQINLIPVNEDGLFDCDISKMYMKPVYWDGPIYEIRRGTWFMGDLPLSADIADQLEESYLKLTPYLLTHEYNERQIIDTASSKSTDVDDKISKTSYNTNSSSFKPLTTKIKSEFSIFKEKKNGIKEWPFENPTDYETNDQIVVFTDSKTAYIMNADSTLTNFQVNYFYNNDKPTPTPVFGSTKVERGYKNMPIRETQNKEDDLKSSKPRSKSNATASSANPLNAKSDTDYIEEPSSVLDTIKDKFSLSSNERLQADLESDYANDSGQYSNSREREIDHLILCVHGIGQILATKFSGIGFVSSCSRLRRLLKTLFQENQEYSEMAYPELKDILKDNTKNKKKIDESFTNNRIQVLPIVWRNDVNFSFDSVVEEKREDGGPRLPTLNDITINSVKSFRDLLAGLVLDILLYYEPEFKLDILKSVTRQANQIYDKYMERNPNFKGKIHFLGHSLGSSVCFDLLSNQPNKLPEFTASNNNHEKFLKFQVDTFFGLGSPNGPFRLLKKQNILPRSRVNFDGVKSEDYLFQKFQSPLCNNYYNVFYNTDPVAYRVEPLIHTSLSKVQPVPVPFADPKGFNYQMKSLTSFGDTFMNNVAGLVKFPNSFVSPLLNTVSNAATSEKEADAAGTAGKQAADESKTQINSADAKELEKGIEESVKELLKEINKTGRVDYQLPEGLFDISAVTAIGSHTQYFDDLDVVGFLLTQLHKKGK